MTGQKTFIAFHFPEREHPVQHKAFARIYKCKTQNIKFKYKIQIQIQISYLVTETKGMPSLGSLCCSRQVRTASCFFLDNTSRFSNILTKMVYENFPQIMQYRIYQVILFLSIRQDSRHKEESRHH